MSPDVRRLAPHIGRHRTLPVSFRHARGAPKTAVSRYFPIPGSEGMIAAWMSPV